MQEIEGDQLSEAIEPTVEYEGECPSISGRSTLTFQIGRNPTDTTGERLFRISDNTGKGMWCKGWAAVSEIDALLSKTEDISARTFNDVHPGKSINTGGFILAVLKNLDVVKPKEESRCHERVPGASLQQAIAFKLKEVAALDKHRKTKAG
ncbi:hypothetical protein [Ramlibacter alkalitolerans]|uniref:Uncharacterized protein n=1 Tax=Ramlibacter alkalitolerans TaxID=2039631 RepID=A0ABS1JXC1_9BURK|nr:hypothetical protein [Ramlibacter alkalitolerans]MBL0428726.1 hypothetical protein [Ramlibacter alkalitolerans]